VTKERLHELRTIALQYKGKRKSADFILELIDEYNRVYSIAMDACYGGYRDRSVLLGAGESYFSTKGFYEEEMVEQLNKFRKFMATAGKKLTQIEMIDLCREIDGTVAEVVRGAFPGNGKD
jgi:hypothetical protein